ncbi:MAG: hypothetical protein ACK41V_23645, partial [Acidovorax sp.]|uniref:hypothetical protein n=1 Tax=Acidovorax sp. TaxID=1872122 RepID=UPI00391B4C06
MGPAITKAAFAYYQSLPLLLIADPAGSPLLHAAWSAQEVFNFQLPSSAAGGDAGVCLFRGMTPVHREVVGMAAAAAVLLALPLLHVLHAVAARALPAVRPCLPARLAACLPRLSLPAAHVYAGAFTSLVML